MGYESYMNDGSDGDNNYAAAAREKRAKDRQSKIDGWVEEARRAGLSGAELEQWMYERGIPGSEVGAVRSGVAAARDRAQQEVDEANAANAHRPPIRQTPKHAWWAHRGHHGPAHHYAHVHRPHSHSLA